MSEVNNTMLSFSVLEAEARRMVEVNASSLLREQVFVDNTGYPATGWGGSKYPEKPVWAAAFNYVPLEDVLEAARSAKWEYPAEVQILWHGQHDDLWTVHAL